MTGCERFNTLAASSANQENAFFPPLLAHEQAQKLYRGAKKM
jgi:hypothetical protein